MKKIALSVFLFIMCSLLFAADGDLPDLVFDIKAYKLGQTDESIGEYFELTVTDALSGSLSVVDDRQTDDVGKQIYDEVDLTDYIEKYLGTLPQKAGTGSGAILYSYRVAGNVTGKYNIGMSIHRFSGSKEEDSIDAFYEIMNENIIFNHSSTTKSADGFEIKQNNTGSKFDATSDTEPSVDLSTGIEITGTGTSKDIWIARGAVSAVIDKSGYEGAANDEYKSFVTVSVSPVV